MRASRFIQIGIAVLTTAVLSFGGVSVANAADAVPNVATQPTVAATANPSPDPAPTATPVTEAPAPAPVPSQAPAEDKSVQAPAIQPAVKSVQQTTNVGQDPPKAKAMSSKMQPSSQHSDPPTTPTHVKVTICHRTDSATNPYRQITVDDSAVDGVGNGDHYSEHQGPLASTTVVAQQLKDAHTKWGDIIPPLAGVHNGLNWTTEGQAIYNANCVVPTPPVVVKNEVGVYIYKALDATKAPSWGNAGDQTFCGSKDGSDWFTTLPCALPTEVCGPGWDFQQDKVKNWTYEGAFKWPSSIQSGVDNIGWPPIYDAKHGHLSDLITVPDCAPPPPTDVCKNIAGDQATVPAGFVQDGVNCKPVHAVCTASNVDPSVWSTEDGAPTVGNDGMDFSTPAAGDKVNYFGRTLNVPFAGISGGSYTVKNTGGPITAYDMEVFQNGTSSFATIVFEPYVNGLTGTGTSGDGTFHTYTITPDSLVWNSKITSGEGSQAQPVTLTRMQELIPAATLIRAGLGQGRNNAGSLSTVSSFTDPACGYTVFPKTPPVVVAPKATISAGACYYNADQKLSFKPITLTFDNSASNQPVEFVVSAPYGDLSRTVPAGETVTVQAQDGWQNGVGYEVTAGGQTFELNIPAFDSCAPVVTPVTPEGVWFHDSCGATDDSVNVPGTLDGAPSVTTNPITGDVITHSSYTSSQGVYVVVDTTTKDGVRTAQVTFIPADSAPVAKPGANDTYVVVTIDGVTYAQWTYTFTNEPCSTTPPTTPPTPPVTPPTAPNHPAISSGHGGANTGLSGNQPGASTSFWTAGNTALFGGSAFLFIVALFGALTVVRRRKRTNGEAGVESL